MIAGVSVVVRRPTAGEPDEFNNATTSEHVETVENVLVAPVAGDDLSGSTRPDGDRAGLTLHFPKTYTESLRNCTVEVFGQEWSVVGDPQPYLDALAPGLWNRPVSVEAVDG